MKLSELFAGNLVNYGNLDNTYSEYIIHHTYI